MQQVLERKNGAPTKNRTWNTDLEDPCYIRLTIGAKKFGTPGEDRTRGLPVISRVLLPI